MRYYAITGRFSGDEEDTLLLITAEDTDPAVTAYKAELCRIRNCAEDEENEIYLNTLVWANTPIFEM